MGMSSMGATTVTAFGVPKIKAVRRNEYTDRPPIYVQEIEVREASGEVVTINIHLPYPGAALPHSE